MPPKLLAEAFDGWHNDRAADEAFGGRNNDGAPPSEREALMAMKGRIEEYTSAVREAERGAVRDGAVRGRQTKDQQANPRPRIDLLFTIPSHNLPQSAASPSGSWQHSGPHSGSLPSTSSRVTLSHTWGTTTHQ